MELNLIEGVSPWLQLSVLVAILLTQGVTLFILAKKRNKNAWFWGVSGLIQFPFPSIFYYIFVVRYSKKINKEETFK